MRVDNELHLRRGGDKDALGLRQRRGGGERHGDRYRVAEHHRHHRGGVCQQAGTDRRFVHLTSTHGSSLAGRLQAGAAFEYLRADHPRRHDGLQRADGDGDAS